MMFKTFNTLSFLFVALFLLTSTTTAGAQSIKTLEQQKHLVAARNGVRGAGVPPPSAHSSGKATSSSSSTAAAATSSYECPVNAPLTGSQCEVPPAESSSHVVCEYLHIQVPSDFDAATGVCSGELVCKPTTICGCGVNGQWECFDMDYVNRCNVVDNQLAPAGAFQWCSNNL